MTVLAYCTKSAGRWSRMMSVCGGGLLMLLGLVAAGGLFGSENRYDAPNMGNPILPGYFADPTVRKFGDTFYIYSTTDGTGGGVGRYLVWSSTDFVNWTSHPLNWPDTYHKWAPEVVRGDDGRFYMLSSVPVHIYGAVSETPYGPWENMLPDGRPLIPAQYVPPVITLDGQFFRDDDGRWYSMFCTWAIYPGHGVGMVEHDSAMFPIDSERFMIPNTQLIDVFEAPFMVKKDGLYCLMYSAGSCHDHTYQVRYGVAEDIRGPYTYPDNNPILQTTPDRTIHGPGHHSVLELDGKYYIVYHRHNNPFSTFGMHRQVAADVMEFGARGIIENVRPTHTGIGYLGPDSNPFENLAFGQRVAASSYYSDDFRPEFAVDDNNGTLWRAAVNTPGSHSLTVDLGEVRRFRRVHTQFEYVHWYYQYLLEHSLDGVDWEVFSDKRDNRIAGSPMVDFGDAEARYVRLTVTNWEYPGLGAAVWNLKVFKGAEQDPPQLLVHLEAGDLDEGTISAWSNNMGMLGGLLEGAATVARIDGVRAVIPDDEVMTSSFDVPETLTADRPFTWIKKVYRDGEWRFVGQTSESGHRDFEPGRPLRLRAGEPVASLRLFNRVLAPAEIEYYQALDYQPPSDPAPESQGLLVHLEPGDLTFGSEARNWLNRGTLGGEFVAGETPPVVTMQNGRQALAFNGRETMRSSFIPPASLAGNSSFTVAVWALNPEIDGLECLVSWAPRGGIDGRSAQLNYGSQPESGALLHQGWPDMGYRPVPPAGEWHHIAVTFDGYRQRIFVNGELNNQEQKMLFLNGGAPVFLGTANGQTEPYSGLLGSVRIYDRALDEEEIIALAEEPVESDLAINLDAAGLQQYGPLERWENNGLLGGSLSFRVGTAAVEDVAGRIAVVFPGRLADAIVSAPDEIPFERIDIAGYSREALLSPNRDEWFHVVLVSGNGQSIHYIDGEEHHSEPSWLADLNAGAYSGAVALFRVHNKVLDPGEVNELYRLWVENREPPAFTADTFEAGPEPLSTVAVGMTAPPVRDTRGALYYFEEVTGQSGGRTSGWTRERFFMNHGLQPDTEYAYQVKARDVYGNVSAPLPLATVVTDSGAFDEFVDPFDTTRDFRQNGVSDTIWHGLIEPADPDAAVVAAGNGVLRLESERTWWDNSVASRQDPNQPGPFLYRRVEGDFTAEVRIADFQGLADRSGTMNNDGGIMVRLPEASERGPGEKLVQLSFFPHYNVGNMWTSLDGNTRPQSTNQLGWNAPRWLQVQREGDLFHFRISPDGLIWEAMPGSPQRRQDLAGQTVQVGLYQSMYGNARSWVEFDNFRLSVRRP